MKLFFVVVFASLFATGQVLAENLAWSDCDGIVEKPDGGITFPSPMTADVMCYPEDWVDGSRFAALLAFKELVREFGLDVTMTAIPLSWQVESDGPHYPAWEVYIYSVETGKVLMLYLVKSETGLIKKICDNRFDDQKC